MAEFTLPDGGEIDRHSREIPAAIGREPKVSLHTAV